jgi:hypothetical protein
MGRGRRQWQRAGRAAACLITQATNVMNWALGGDDAEAAETRKAAVWA